MSAIVEIRLPPIHMDADGVFRVGKTRVTLDTVVSAFNDGATAEEIAQQYPSLHLADIYAVITYYLQQRDQVEKYLAERKVQAEEVRCLNQSKYDAQELRARLFARHTKNS